MAIAGSD